MAGQSSTTTIPARASAPGSAPPPAVRVECLTKTYRTRDGLVEAVRAVSFEVPRGHVVSFVGPSGCGKSTLLKMIAGLVEFEEGRIDVAGAPAAPGRRDCGIMLQSAVLLPWRSIWDNVMLPIEILGMDRRQARERAAELFELVGLEGFESKRPWELSGGMQQRASLARLLVFDPEILLMDEPFAALDEFTRERLDVELAQLQATLQRTVVYVTHNIGEAVMLSDEVIVMTPRPGEIVDRVTVDLPRPRDGAIMASPRSIELRERIRRALGHEAGGWS